VGFKITQHSRDAWLMNSLITFFGCGRVEGHPLGLAVDFVVTKLSDIGQIILFFEKYPIRGSKAKNFSDFCKVVELMKNKTHLTDDGLDQIQKIKSGMNSLRK
jgi:hypothetical protein